MEYRKLPKGTEQIGVLGFGTSAIGAAGAREIEATAALAVENGANYFDLASDCIGCGHCDRRCPFHVVQTQRMREIAAYFGK